MNPAAFGLYDVVLRQCFQAGKSPSQTLRACAAWISAPFPVQAIAGAS